MNDKYVIWDIETLANFTSFYFKDYKSKKEKYYIMSPWQNDFKPLMKFMRQLKDYDYTLVGFNSIGFDSQILEYLIFNYKKLSKWTGEQIAKKCHEKSQWIINLPMEEKYMNLIPEWNLSHAHIDLYKQKHYDGKGKRCSLKWLEFTLRMENIESMPIHHDTLLDDEAQSNQIIAYNATDVRATEKVFEINKFETDLRIQLSEEYDLNLMNASEPKLARDIFGKFLSESMGMPYRDLKEKRTYRSLIKARDVIFDYVIFKDPILKGVKEFYEKLEFNPYKFEENNMGLKKVKKTFKIHNIKDADVGLGGIHACVEPGVYTSRPDWHIKDIDVTSYYPNLGIENDLHPEHLDQGIFCSTYKKLFDMRQEIPKESPINLVYKIILNSTYGLSKEANNYLHDPKYTFAITINGQLLLLMLAELLSVKVKNVVFYQLNTDGISIGYHPDQEEVVIACMRKWEKYTRLKLEDKFYDKMVIVDVNNYLAVDTKGKVKRKGVFAYSMNPADKELEYHKNPSFLVIPKALEAYFVNNVPYIDYIKSNQDIYDFCAGIKVKRDFNIVEHWYDSEDVCIRKRVVNERVIRYYVTKEFLSLKKTYNLEAKMAGKTVEIEKGWNTKLFNTYYEAPMEAYNLDYQYYISETRKVVDLVSKNATNLKLF